MEKKEGKREGGRARYSQEGRFSPEESVTPEARGVCD
jgi:hypothetical protein